MTTKKAISISLLLVFLSASFLPFLSGCQKKHDILDVESIYLKKYVLSDYGITSIRAIDYTDGQFVALTDSSLIIFDPYGLRPVKRTISLPDTFCSMKTYAGLIYLLSQNKLQVYQYKDLELGPLEREYEIPVISESFHVFKLDICENYALISYREVRMSESGRYIISDKLVSVDLSDGEVQFLDEIPDFQFRIGTVREKDILLLNHASGPNSGSVYPYDKQLSLAVCKMTGTIDMVNIQYDAARDLVWYMGDGKISYVSLSKNDSGVFYHIGPDMNKSVEGLYLVNGIFPLKDRLYVVSVDEGIIYEMSAASNEDAIMETDDGHILNILMLGMQETTFDGMKDAAEEMFGTKVRLTVFDSISEDAKIRLKLLSGDTDFDLYGIVPESLAYYASVNALVDLSGDEVIQKHFSNMIDGVKELCTIGDVLCGVPVKYWFNLEVYRVNEELLNLLGAEVPMMPLTWEEALEYGHSLKATADELGIEDFYLYDDWRNASMVISYLSNYCHYEDHVVEDRRDDLERALTAYYQMVDEGLVRSGSEKGISLFSWRKNEFNHQKPYQLLTASPVIAEGAKNPIYLSVLAINPHTPYQNEAIEYLRQISSFEFLRTFPMLLVLKDPSKYDYIDPAFGRFELDPNSEAFLRICQIFKNSTRYFINDELDEKLSDLCDHIADRTITVDEYVEEFYRKVSLLVLE